MPARQWDPASKAKGVLEGLKGKPEAAICKRHRIRPSEYRLWRKQFLKGIAKPFDERDRGAKAAASAPFASLWNSALRSEALQAARELFEAMPIPVFLKARDGRHLGANQAWEDYFGVSNTTFVGKTAGELFASAPEVAAQHEAVDANLWRNPGTRSYE